MTSADQVALFEPMGSELVELARKELVRAQSFETAAQSMTLRGFVFASRSFARKSADAMYYAELLEITYQFETLAGLV